MIERGKGVGHRPALCIHQAQARFGVNVADAGDRRVAGQGRSGHGVTSGSGRREQQLVVVAPGQGPVAPLGGLNWSAELSACLEVVCTRGH